MSAVRQILCAKGKRLQPGEEEELIKKIEETAKRFVAKGIIAVIHI